MKVNFNHVAATVCVSLSVQLWYAVLRGFFHWPPFLCAVAMTGMAIWFFAELVGEFVLKTPFKS